MTNSLFCSRAIKSIRTWDLCAGVLSWCSKVSCARIFERRLAMASSTCGRQWVVYQSLVTVHCCTSGTVATGPVLAMDKATICWATMDHARTFEMAPNHLVSFEMIVAWSLGQNCKSRTYHKWRSTFILQFLRKASTSTEHLKVVNHPFYQASVGCTSFISPATSDVRATAVSGSFCWNQLTIC
jgi:hypothetical protein